MIVVSNFQNSVVISKSFKKYMFCSEGLLSGLLFSCFLVCRWLVVTGVEKMVSPCY